MNADGSNVIRLTQNDSAETSPAWSPDGSMIAFARAIECYYLCISDIFVMNADGSNVRRLATGWTADQDHDGPSWSPNGRAIAFTAFYCPRYEFCAGAGVWLVDLQDTPPRLVVNNGIDPAWQP